MEIDSPQPCCLTRREFLLLTAGAVAVPLLAVKTISFRPHAIVIAHPGGENYPGPRQPLPCQLRVAEWKG